MKLESLTGMEIDSLSLDHLLLHEGDSALYSTIKSEVPPKNTTTNLLGQGFGGARSIPDAACISKPESRSLVEVTPLSPQETQSILDECRKIPKNSMENPSKLLPLPPKVGSGSCCIYNFEGVRLDEALEDVQRYRDILADIPPSILSTLSRLHSRNLAFGGLATQRCFYDAKSAIWRIMVGGGLKEDKHGKESARDLESVYEMLSGLAETSDFSEKWRKMLPGFEASGKVARAEALKEGPFFGNPALEYQIEAGKEHYRVAIKSHREFRRGMLRGDSESIQKHEHQVMNIADLPLIGASLDPNDGDTWNIPFAADHAFVGFERSGGWIRLGRIIRLSTVPDVSRVALQREGESTIVSWDWPTNLEVAEVRTFAEDGTELFSHRVFDFQFQSFRGFHLQTSALTSAARIQVLGAVPVGNGRWDYSAGLTNDCQIIL